MDIKIKSALISVSDKSGLDDVVKKLHEQSVKLISTGGTAQFISDMNIPVIDVSEVTKFPEMMGGRVKTLHPKIHGGLLAARDNQDHTASQDMPAADDIHDNGFFVGNGSTDITAQIDKLYEVISKFTE